MLSWYRDTGGGSIFSEPESIVETRQTGGDSTGTRSSRGQKGTIRGLLEQHLKNDRLWKVLSQWEKAYDAHQVTRVALQRKTVIHLEEKTGIKLTDQNNVPPPFIFSYTTGELFSR